MRHCNAKCDKFAAKLPVDGGRYASGQKRCNVCEQYMIWEGKFCPCCGSKLRVSARNGIYKEKFLVGNRI